MHRKRPIGRLDKQWTFQRNSGPDAPPPGNSFGEVVPAWSDVFTVWGSEESSGGREIRDQAGQTQQETDVEIEIRYRSDVTARLRCFRIHDVLTFSAVAATDLLTAAGRVWTKNERVRVASSGTLPGGLVSGQDYYTIAATGGSTFKLSATEGGPAIDITSAGSGTHSIYQVTLIEITDARDREGRRERLILTGRRL